MSLGYYSVSLTINNNSGMPMSIVDLHYDHGKVNDFSEWPQQIAHGRTVTIENSEHDWSVLGISGHVTYKMKDTPVTIAFSRPTVGPTKLNIGTTNAQSVVSSMTSHGGEEFAVRLIVGGNTSLAATCQVKAGWIKKELIVNIYKSRD